MVALLKNHLPEIQHLCEPHRIAKLWVFGSALEATHFQADGNVDFLYQFDDGGRYQDGFPYFRLWSDLLSDLRNLLGRDVQLIAYDSFKKPYFHSTVEATKQLIYEKEGVSKKKLEQMIKEDFDQYDDVFQALA